jgi:hypothetical protein
MEGKISAIPFEQKYRETFANMSVMILYDKTA